MMRRKGNHRTEYYQFLVNKEVILQNKRFRVLKVLDKETSQLNQITGTEMIVIEVNADASKKDPGMALRTVEIDSFVLRESSVIILELINAVKNKEYTRVSHLVRVLAENIPAFQKNEKVLNALKEYNGIDNFDNVPLGVELLRKLKRFIDTELKEFR